MPDEAAPFARGVRNRRHRDHHSAASAHHRAAVVHRRRLRYPLAGEAGGLEEVSGRSRARKHRCAAPHLRHEGGLTLMEITPELLLQAYRIGVFPMGERRDDPKLYWLDPRLRAILPLDAFHLPQRLKRTVRQDRFE